MSPPTKRPRLTDLDPLQVAAEACSLIVAHLARLFFALAPAVPQVVVPGDPDNLARGTDVGLTMQHLTRFAQEGYLGDWPDAACALDAMQSVCEALYSQAGVTGTFGIGDLEGEADADTPVGLVLVAALARVKIEQKQAVTAKELAALGSCSSPHVRLLARQGELRRREDGSFAAKVARRWLERRGVRGWA